MPEILKLPMSCEELCEWLPHRGPAAWIDELVEVDPEGGKCRVRLREGASYLDSAGEVRSTSYIEFMAQTYGFVAAGQVLSGLFTGKKPELVYLAQVKNFSVEKSATPPNCHQQSPWLEIKVRRTHVFGPITLVDAEVTDSQGRVVSRASLRVFARQTE